MSPLFEEMSTPSLPLTALLMTSTPFVAARVTVFPSITLLRIIVPPFRISMAPSVALIFLFNGITFKSPATADRLMLPAVEVKSSVTERFVATVAVMSFPAKMAPSVMSSPAVSVMPPFSAVAETGPAKALSALSSAMPTVPMAVRVIGASARQAESSPIWLMSWTA